VKVQADVNGENKKNQHRVIDQAKYPKERLIILSTKAFIFDYKCYISVGGIEFFASFALYSRPTLIRIVTRAINARHPIDLCANCRPSADIDNLKSECNPKYFLQD
jgi:hypothetical protein